MIPSTCFCLFIYPGLLHLSSHLHSHLVFLITYQEDACEVFVFKYRSSSMSDLVTISPLLSLQTGSWNTLSCLTLVWNKRETFLFTKYLIDPSHMHVPWTVNEDVIRIIIFIAQPHGPYSLQSRSHYCPLNIRFPNSRGATYGVIFTFQVTLAASSAASIPHWDRNCWSLEVTSVQQARFCDTQPHLAGCGWVLGNCQTDRQCVSVFNTFLSLKSCEPDGDIQRWSEIHLCQSPVIDMR